MSHRASLPTPSTPAHNTASLLPNLHPKWHPNRTRPSPDNPLSCSHSLAGLHRPPPPHSAPLILSLAAHPPLPGSPSTPPPPSLGRNVKQLVERKDHCFRRIRAHVYYVSEKLMFLATNVGRDELMSLGTCLGKFTKSEKFRLEVTALQMIAPLAQNKVWVKANAEMAFLYGNHIAKAGLARMTDEVQQYDGVVVFNASDVPLGFGVAAHATLACQTLEPTAHAILHQADVGEYLRRESELS